MSKQRCGYAAVIGLPNAGKSTLVNTLVGSKVSIVSKRVQTTRCRVLGIALQKDAQVILIDTPGIFTPEKTLEKAMVHAAWESIEKADAIVHIVDAGFKDALQRNQTLIQNLPRDIPVILVLNKVDKVDKPALLSLATGFNEAYPYAATFMISAMKGQGSQDVLSDLSGRMPEGEWIFDEDQITDMPMRLMAAEITREKIFNMLYQELPYSVMVETEKWEEFKNGSVKIDQAVYVQKDSQKAIVLGKGGSQIKKIGETARKDMEQVFGMPVHLKLFVKVEKDWSEDAANYRHIGLDYKN
jgi:GTP-binding protein Era